MTMCKTKFTGPLPFRMTNDFLFKYLLQEDVGILKGLICSFLNMDESEIREINVTNPISLSDDVNSKEMILDIKAILNDSHITNLEMQVINNHDWPERSLSYLCRCFDNLQKGAQYSHVKSAVHIGFLDYTLFPERPEFFSTYQLINPNNGQLYTGKFLLNVVDLTLTDKATSDDIIHHRNLWARFFKAETWEELHMLSEKDEYIEKAVSKVAELSEDELFREKCFAREDKIRQQLDFQYYYETQISERDKEIERKDAEIEQKDAEIARLKALLSEKK